MKLGPLIILSGPSGVGKSTVVARLLRESGLPLRKAVSVTTRRARKGEVDGVDYYFWTRERFQEEVAAASFLEWATVHGQNYYGTLRSEVDEYRRQGIGVLLVIDVQGAAKVRQQCHDAVSIFLTAPVDVLLNRLKGRGSEDETIVRHRLETAREELKRIGEYEHAIVNDDLNETVARLRELLDRYFSEGI